MNDPFFNEKLRNIDKYEVIGKDIVYQDGIEEVLNIKKDIDLIILRDNLVVKKKITDVIEKIKKLENVDEVTYNRNILLVNYKEGKNNLVDMIDYLKKESIKYNKIYSERPTLNDVFLELTGKELRD